LIALVCALLLAPPLALDENAATARLAELRDSFSRRAKAESIADLERLANEAPSTEAAGRALLWLGDLARQDHQTARAVTFYTRAYGFTGEVHRLAARGRGDMAMIAHHYGDALRFYDEARPGASPVLSAELDQKRELAIRLTARRVWAWIAWALYAAVVAFFVARARPWRGEVRVPTEALYAAPIYALLILGCLGRDATVLHALVLCAPGSLLVIAASGLAARRAPTRKWLHATLLVAANFALFYGAIHRAGLVDTLLITIGIAANAPG
jgi:hypothetical protein